MLDKEFDMAFKSSFEDFEVEPTAEGWENIKAQLDEKPKDKKLPIFWLSAAASIMIVLSIGIFMYQKPTEDIIKLRADNMPKKVVITDEKTEEVYSNNEKPKVIGNKTDVAAEDNNLVPAVIKNTVVNANLKTSTKKENNPLEKNNLNDATLTPRTSVVDVYKVEQVIAETKPVRKPTVTEKMIIEEAKIVKLNKNQTTLAINTNEENLNDEGAQSDRKIKIKSVADIVNFVVSKVDKREEKIIRISKTDESDNEITGINLGLFKFRKAEK